MTDFLTPLRIDTLRAAGVPEPWNFGVADRVRFYELDALNHVNNTAYLRWFETVRVAYVDAYGLSDYGPDDPTLVLRRVECEYFRPMFIKQDYIVTARCESFRTSSFVKHYGVWADGQMMAEGRAVVVVTDASGTTKTPLPEPVKEAFVSRDGATPTN